jgi:hypothetical protein
MPQPITFEQLYRDFGESWRVTQAESLFDYGPGEDTNSFTDRSFPAAPCPPIPDSKRLAAEQACQSAGITDKDLLDACIFDVGNTGDVRFVDSHVGLGAPKSTLTVLADVAADQAATVPEDTIISGRGGCSVAGFGRKGLWLIPFLASVLLGRRWWRRSRAGARGGSSHVG